MKKYVIFFLLCCSLAAQSQTILPRATIKSWFFTGARPTAQQYQQWLDSYRHKDDSLIWFTDNGAKINWRKGDTVKSQTLATGGGAANLWAGIDTTFTANGTQVDWVFSVPELNPNSVRPPDFYSGGNGYGGYLLTGSTYTVHYSYPPVAGTVIHLKITGNYGGNASVTPPVNLAPVVNAGSNQTIQLPATASLTGSATDDGLPSNTLTKTWSKVSGAGTVNFSSPNQLNTTAAFSTGGVYVLRLTVSDGLLSAYANVQITANTANQNPTANAGNDYKLFYPTSTYSLTGTGSDVDGNISSYAWSVIAGSGVTIASPNSATTAISGLTNMGSYTLRLTVTDNQGATATDDITVTVSTNFGVLNANPSQYNPIALSAATDMVFKTYRTGQILDKGYQYSNGTNTIDAGFGIVHNISGHISNTDSTKPFVGDDSLSTMLPNVFTYWYNYTNKSKVYLFVYDNEEDNMGYHGMYSSLTAQLNAYVGGMQIFYNAAHARGFKVANAGITGLRTLYMLAYWYQQNDITKFRALRDNYFGGGTADSLSGLIRDEAIAVTNYTVAVKNYIDFFNVHQYDKNAITLLPYLWADIKTMIAEKTGKPVITNEVGGYSINGNIVAWEYNGIMAAQWPYAVYYFGNNTSEAAPANDAGGVLNANGLKAKELNTNNN